MSRVYGDSTPFPHDLDFIALLEQGIECAVKLVSAQEIMQAAVERVAKVQAAEKTQQAEFTELFNQIEAATSLCAQQGSERRRQAAARIIAAGRQIVGEAAAAVSTEVGGQQAQAQTEIEGARKVGYMAIEAFIRNHTPPGSSLGLRWSCIHEQCTAQTAIGTPFNLKAVFASAIPEQHPWARCPRVAELTSNVEIRTPKEAGWISKRVEMSVVRLERYFVTDAQIAANGGSFQVRKALGAGTGFEVTISPKGDEPVIACPLLDSGQVELEKRWAPRGSDAECLLALWKSIVNSSADLTLLRTKMASAYFGNQSLESVESPIAIADALIRDMAPLTVEISKRSGAPGELVLRRNLGGRKREETYLTHAELLQKIFVLAPESRRVFAPLGLSTPELGPLSIAPSSQPKVQSPHSSGRPRPAPAVSAPAEDGVPMTVSQAPAQSMPPISMAPRRSHRSPQAGLVTTEESPASRQRSGVPERAPEVAIAAEEGPITTGEAPIAKGEKTVATDSEKPSPPTIPPPPASNAA